MTVSELVATELKHFPCECSGMFTRTGSIAKEDADAFCTGSRKVTFQAECGNCKREVTLAVILHREDYAMCHEPATAAGVS